MGAMIPMINHSSTTIESHPATSSTTASATCMKVLSMDAHQLEAIEVLQKAVMTASRDDLPNLVGDVARLQALAFVRLASAGGTREHEQPEPDDRLLDAEQAAAMLGLSVAALKRRRWPFRRPLGHKTIRYSANGIRKYLAKRPV